MRITEHKLEMRRPDNWHNHFRQKGDPRFGPTVRYIASQFARSNAMGNLSPDPVLTAEQMVSYEADIREVAEENGYRDFQPLMVVMLSHQTTPAMLEAAFDAGAYGVKDMPANGTTNSAHGIFDRQAPLYRDCLRVTRDRQKAWLVHAEVPMKDGQVVPMALRSKLFLPVFEDILNELPELPTCVEHIDIKELVELVEQGGEGICATVTPHHMEVTANDADYDNHLKCMPYPKELADIEAILQVVMNGHPRFFYGSDNAPHLLPDKLKSPPNSGVFTAPVELGVLADLFERHRSLFRLEAFLSEFGAKWHGYPLNADSITLIREPHLIPEIINLPGGHQIVPYKHGQVVNWQLVS